MAGYEIFSHHHPMDDAKRKPHPEGLHKILGGRDPSTALYLGDNIDDALAAREANVRSWLSSLPASMAIASAQDASGISALAHFYRE